MMLMNSAERRFLIGEQIRGAPYLKKFELKLCLQDMLWRTRGPVGEVGSADLIQPDDHDLVTPMLTAQMYGLNAYLEAGSGASSQVNLN